MSPRFPQAAPPGRMQRPPHSRHSGLQPLPCRVVRMLTTLCLLLAAGAALAFYLATKHQNLCPAGRRHARGLRIAGTLAVLSGLAAGIAARGTWAGSFTTLTALMQAAVLLPCIDAGRRLRREHADAV